MTENFTKWPELAPELKMIVIGNLDYLTRTRLAFCSKQDYEIVNLSLIQINSIEMYDAEFDFDRGVEESLVRVRIEFGENEENKRVTHLIFSGTHNYTEVRKFGRQMTTRKVSKVLKLEGCDYYAEAVKLVEKWLENARFGVKSMTVAMKKYPLENSKIQFLASCEKFEIEHANEETLKWWLEKVPTKLKRLQLSSSNCNVPLSTQLLSMEHFKLCDTLYIRGSRINFTDDQFLSMNGSYMVLESSTITDRAINQFIRNWIDGRVRQDFRFLHIISERVFSKNVIFANITSRPWDNAFEEESGDFCETWRRAMGGADCNQISKGDDSGTSATLDISEFGIIFAITGGRLGNEGSITTQYSIPEN